ncbi:Fanconi anemia group B protein [Oryzias melastigma]|uniref:FA complementation group B n=1 Tax=Oryzias melastigma TaxID=30732 RepID=A0A3B3BL62_ORYME|nr:Fanconi anemia group B protein [Oryzias melastigma]
MDIFDDLNARHLSHGGHLMAFSCKRSKTESEGERTELLFRKLVFEPDRNRFVNAARGSAVIGRKTSACVNILKCERAVDVQGRVRAACVLVTRRSGKVRAFKYSLLTVSSSDQLEPRIEFKLPYQMTDRVSILQGPTVMWTHDGCIFYTSIQAEGVRKIPISLSPCVFGELPLCKPQAFIIGQSEGSANNQPTTLAYLVGDGQVFDGSVILPHPYVGITESILVLRADREDAVLKCNLVAATSSQQLVYFESGIAKDACPLPFEQAEDIQVADLGRNGSIIVISFHQGNVCAVWKDTFQVASQWSGVRSVHIGDFLRCGTDQLLLVFDDQEELKKHFLITDLCGIFYSGGQEDPDVPTKTLPSPENSRLTLQALESRLQSGLIVLQDLQKEERVKNRVIHQALQVLTDLASERRSVLTQHEQEDLVPLWDSDEESKEKTSKEGLMERPAVSGKPRIEKLWHRITGEQMVVGVTLTADHAVPMSTVSLSLLSETGQSSTPAVIQTRSQAFWLTAPCPPTPSTSSSASTFSEPPAKRCKQPVASNDLNTCRLAVTAVTRLANLLNSGCVKCSVTLHYSQKTDASCLVSNSTSVFLHCGQVVVDIRDAFPSQLLKIPQQQTDEVKEDLLSLMAVLDRWILHIDSPDYSLGDLEGWLQKKAGCKKMEAFPQYFLSQASTPMLLSWSQITPFQGQLTIHSCHLQMLQFLDVLLAFLPASCLIRPAKCARGQRTGQMFALALEKEVLSLKEGLSKLLVEEDERGGSPVSWEHEDPAEVLERRRERWQLDRERSRRRLSPLVDVGRYRNVVRHISQVQMGSDLAAVLYTLISS